MAPKKVPNANPEGEEVPDRPPSPPPPSEAWRAIMQATNQNTQMLMQMMQNIQANQGAHGNQGQGNLFNQPHFASLNQFLANQPKAFSYCVDPLDAEDWITDIKKHFECSNVRPEDYVKFTAFQFKDQAADWWQQ